MVKSKHRFNKKARMGNGTNKNTEKCDMNNIVQIEGLKEQIQMENDTNMLVLPSKKEKKFNENDLKSSNGGVKKSLSKKQRKHLEKVLEKKEKSLKREELLENLAKLQVNSNELKLYSSVKDIGKKEKRKLDNIDFPKEPENEFDANGDTGDEPNRKINTISGSNKKRKSDVEADNESTDTDAYSTDSEIDQAEIDKALAFAREKQQKETLAKSIAKIELEKKLAEEKLKEEERLANLIGIERKSKAIYVERSDEVRESRSKLPIITEEQVIMEKIFENEITILCGETGT